METTLIPGQAEAGAPPAGGAASPTPRLLPTPPRADSPPKPPLPASAYPRPYRPSVPLEQLVPAWATPKDAAWYPLREDFKPVEGIHQARLLSHLHEGVPIVNPAWGVYRNTGIYYQEGDQNACVAPDLTVLAEPYQDPDPGAEIIRLWHAPEILLVTEVRSPSNTRAEMERKRNTLARHIRPREYLEVDLGRQALTLHVLQGEEFVAVAPDAEGRLWSAALELWFSLDAEGFVRMTLPDGTRIERHQHDHLAARTERQRADTEAQRAAAAEQLAATAEAERRAERQRAETEAQRAAAAEQLAATAEAERQAEQQRRLAAEQAAARVQAELEELRARLAAGRDNAPD